MKMVNYIVVSGKQVLCKAPVVQWTQHKMVFPHLRPRQRTDLVVTHWTGSENPAEVMYQNLIKRGLSVHFYISYNGTVWQYCDADLLAAHAQGMNDRSVGIEMANRANKVKVEHGVERALIKERIHGKDIVYTLFTPAQVKSALALVSALCTAYGLPMKPPMEPVTRMFSQDAIKVDGSKEPVMRVIPRQLTTAEYERFRGVVGHFHKTKVGKADAGIAILDAIAAYDALGPGGMQ